MSDTAPIPVKSLWRRLGSGPHSTVCRVMGEVEGYIVARNKHATPFLVHRNEWRKRYEEINK